MLIISMFHFVPGVPCAKVERFAGVQLLSSCANEATAKSVKASRVPLLSNQPSRSTINKLFHTVLNPRHLAIDEFSPIVIFRSN
jgi:hypothetical protein